MADVGLIVAVAIGFGVLFLIAGAKSLSKARGEATTLKGSKTIRAGGRTIKVGDHIRVYRGPSGTVTRVIKSVTGDEVWYETPDKRLHYTSTRKILP